MGLSHNASKNPELKGDRSSLPAWRVVTSMILFRPWLWLGNLAAMLVLSAGWVVPGLVIRAFFDLLTDNAQVSLGIWALVALLFASEAGRIVGVLGLIRTNIPFFGATLTLLRKNLLVHILKRPGASALPDSPGEAISRFRGDVFEIPLFALWMNDIQGLLFVSVIAMVLMFQINVSITLYAIVPFFFVGLVANAATSRIERYRRASRRATGIVVGFIGEFFGAVQAVKVATAEDSVLRRFDELNDERRKISLKDRLFNEILHSIFRNAVNLGIGVILILIGQGLNVGSFTIGDFALFVFYLEFISDLTAFTGLLIARYRQIGVSVERMGRLMEGAPPGALIEHSPVYMKGDFPEIVYPSRTENNLLQTIDAKNLTYRFPGSNKGIEGINLHLLQGSFTVVTGRIGSGKTTLMRVLLGLLPKDSGEIRWNNELVDDPGTFFVPPRCAYTSQVPRLFSSSVKENLLMGLPEDDEVISRAIHMAVMDYDLEELEGGLDTIVGPKGVKLSGGQIQRTAAARMFVRNPELLVFDDLSSALDVETERTLWERVFDQVDATCLVVSHRRAVLQRADHVIVLKEGKIEAEGKLDQLLEISEEMQRIWHGEGD
jgi:ATP-binding cassette subfamily B protein